MLDKQGTDLEIEEVEDGASAVEIIKIKQFDCILLDFLFGDSTGYQMLRLIKEIQPKVPILVVTGYDNPSLEDGVLDMGASGFILKKNLSVDNLTKVMEEILQTSQPEGQKGEDMLDDPLSYKGLEGKKLLIVDDTPANITLLRKIFSGKKLPISVAPNGEVALRIAQQALPDLILLDIMMPGIDGFETCKRLKSNEATKDIPVIFISAKGEIEDFVKGLFIGGVDYITKHFRQEEVLARVQIHLRLRKLFVEKEIAQKEADRANRAKSEFLSQMSHELRTPLNAILGFTQLLNIKSDNLRDKQKGYIERIYAAGDHLLQLINEILDLARIDSGNITISLELIHIGQLFDELYGYAHSKADQNEIKIIDQTSDFHNQYILADKTRIKQVFINLISNGIKYNKKGGTLTYSIQKVNHDRLRFNISDTGNGIAKEKLKLLFEPFNRLGAEETDVEGTGIGLCITKQLIGLMNGTIEVESTLGKGSTFCVEIPLAEPPKTLYETSIDLENHFLNVSNDTMINILYVEDNKSNVQLVGEILSNLSNTNLITAHEALIGIDIAQTQQLDLILMDINLPGMDGIKAMEILKKDDKTHNIPIIAVSANAMESDIDKALKAGFDYYIVKPIKVSNFLETVQKVIEDKVGIDS